MAAGALLPGAAGAQQTRFDPQPGAWRSYEAVTRVKIVKPEGLSRTWILLPSVDGDYQKTLGNAWSGNCVAKLHHPRPGARRLTGRAVGGPR